MDVPSKSSLSVKGFLRRQNNGIEEKVRARKMQMSDKLDKHKMQELKEMVKDKDPNQPVEELLAIFCSRHGLSIGNMQILLQHFG